MGKMNFNILCDESCHLQNDVSNVMVLGAITCLEKNRAKHNNNIRLLKNKHGLSTWTELKWTKVSKGKLKLYEELFEYFKNSDDLSVRILVAKDKDDLDYECYSLTHDDWYYRMYYQLLTKLINPVGSLMSYKIFLDIKDTNGGEKIHKFTEVLWNKHRVDDTVIKDIKQIRSHESELLQLVDVFIGAAGYFNRELAFSAGSSEAKNNVVNLVQNKMDIKLDESTPLSELKFNIFVWKPQKKLRG